MESQAGFGLQIGLLCTPEYPVHACKTKLSNTATLTVARFLHRHGPDLLRLTLADFIVERELTTLLKRMNALAGGEPLLSVETIQREIIARDRQLDNPFCKDMQIMAIRAARRYLGDRLIRTARPHRLLDPDAGPLIAVRLHVLTRKTLGGLQTDLDSRVLGSHGQPVQGLYAAGEVAGFGGGGVHGYAALEGTFLGGCIFSGRAAGRAAARSVA